MERGGVVKNDKERNIARIALFVSFAINIFLVAFTLGRFSLMGFAPPPFGMDGHDMMQPPMFEEMPPPPIPDMESHDGRRPHPHFFGPADLFGSEEIKKHSEQMRENFEKIHDLRNDFAKRLSAGSVTKEEVMKHFADIDQLMDMIKKQTQEKAADKISAMTPEERQEFADSLLGNKEKRGK